jgi:hypothetical protein
MKKVISIFRSVFNLPNRVVGLIPILKKISGWPRAVINLVVGTGLSVVVLLGSVVVHDIATYQEYIPYSGVYSNSSFVPDEPKPTYFPLSATPISTLEPSSSPQVKVTENIEMVVEPTIIPSPTSSSYVYSSPSPLSTPTTSVYTMPITSTSMKDSYCLEQQQKYQTCTENYQRQLHTYNTCTANDQEKLNDYNECTIENSEKQADYQKCLSNKAKGLSVVCYQPYTRYCYKPTSTYCYKPTNNCLKPNCY